MDTQLQAAVASNQVDAFARLNTHAAAPPPADRQLPVAESKPAEIQKESNEEPRSKVVEAMAQIQKFVEPMTSELQFSLDEESGMRVVKVMDTSTKEIIRQIPSAEVLEIAKALNRLQGLLLRQKA